MTAHEGKRHLPVRVINLLWFLIPALLTSVALVFVALPSAQREAEQGAPFEAFAALAVFAAVGGVAVGGLAYLIKKLDDRAIRAK